jgi:anthranilate synthase component 1
MQTIQTTQYVTVYPADTQTPISLYLRLVGDQPGILLESAEVDGRLGRYSLIAWDFRLIVACRQGKLECAAHDPAFSSLEELSGSDFVSGLREVLQRVDIVPLSTAPAQPPLTRSLIGVFNYELAGLFEPTLASTLAMHGEQTVLALPGQQILFDHLHHRCLYLSLDNRSLPESHQPGQFFSEPRLGPVTVHPDKELYCEGVARTRELIKQGEAIQVVLSTRFSAPFSGDPFVLYRRLRQANPSPYMFFINLAGITLVGSSPELLVRSTEGLVQERPIAGTRRRGREDSEDRELAAELLQDEKEKAEHLMLVDLGRNDLGRIAAPGSVKVDRFMQVERFSHVMHLTSYLQARLKSGLDSVDVLQATFPAGTVSGAPKIRAMEIIADVEGQRRGPYAGAVGWLGLDSPQINLDTGITIRTLWLENGHLHWQAGAGIVSDSVPDKEWEECCNKAKIINHILEQHGGSDVFAHR